MSISPTIDGPPRRRQFPRFVSYAFSYFNFTFRTISAASTDISSCTRRTSPSGLAYVWMAFAADLACERCKQQHARAPSGTLRERLITSSKGELFLSVARRVSLVICCARPRRRRRRRRRPRRRRSAVRPPPTSTANQDVARPVTVIGARAMVR